jgi:hypothetical protein
MDEQTKLAEDIGRAHGRAAGTWIVDGNTGADQLRALVEQFESGEFLAVNEFSNPLSGEWADGYSLQDLASDVGYDTAGELHFDEGLDELATAYEAGYWEAFELEAERSVRALLPEGSER